jgi:hypothetical protein
MAGGINGARTATAFVLGMHRSGTSAVARVINLLGVPLNVRPDWTPVNPQVNNAGFWESASLTDMNDEILAKLDGSWQAPPHLEDGWPSDPRLDILRTTAPRAFQAAFPTGQSVWKDPRNCLTLPFWLDVLDVTPAIVLVHRSPVEVALSLLRRDALPINHSLALWERYVRSSLGVAAALPTYVVDYPRLLDDPIGSATELQHFLASVGFDVVEPDEAALRSFLSPELRHSSFPDPDAWPPFGVSPEQCVLHAALSSAAGPHEALAALDIGPETVATEVLFQRLQVEREAARRLEASTRLLQEVHEQLNEVRQAVGLLEAQVANLPISQHAHAERTALRDHAAALEHRLDAVERSTALRLLTAPGRLRTRIGQRFRNEDRGADDGSPIVSASRDST